MAERRPPPPSASSHAANGPGPAAGAKNARMPEPPPPQPSASSHAANVRGLAAGANPGQPFGRFGPMFDLPPCPSLPEAGLADLAHAMIKQDEGAPITELEAVDENDRTPSGYTYFGQFVDHDIT